MHNAKRIAARDRRADLDHLGETDRRVHQRKPFHDLFEVAELGLVGAQKLAARWRVIEEITYGDRRAMRKRGGRGLTVVTVDLPGRVAAGDTGCQGQAGYRRNRRQRQRPGGKGAVPRALRMVGR